MKIKILSAIVAVSIAMGLCPLRAVEATPSEAAALSAPLPTLDTVLKRVAEQVEKVDENELMFKRGYSFTRVRKTEYKNSDGEVKKTEEKTKNNNPLTKRVAVVTKPAGVQPANGQGSAKETQANGADKPYERSDFQIDDDMLGRFDITLVRREMLNGRPALVIDFKPTKRKVSEKSIKEKLLNKAAGRVWIDEQESIPAKADLHLSAPVSVFGGLVGAVQKFTYSLNRQRTPEGIWFTVDSDWHLEGREVFFKRIIDYHEATTNVIHVPWPQPATVTTVRQ